MTCYYSLKFPLSSHSLNSPAICSSDFDHGKNSFCCLVLPFYLNMKILHLSVAMKQDSALRTIDCSAHLFFGDKEYTEKFEFSRGKKK